MAEASAGATAAPAAGRAWHAAAAALALAAALAAPGAAATFEAEPYALRPAIAPGAAHMGVRIHGTVRIRRGAEIDGLPVVELSALAWDDDAGLLYALSDRGVLFHLRPVLEDGVLVDVEPVAAHRLRDAAGRPLEGAAADAEGMAIAGGRNGRPGDTELYISFERVHRIVVTGPQGRERRRVPLPGPLDDPGSYVSPNKGLESVALHPRLGVLTAPERPLRGGEDMAVVVRSADGGAWRHALHWTLNGAVVALEALPDGSVLVLERGHGLMFLPVVITLQLADEPAPGAAHLAARELAVFDTSEGWNVDNFEGLARHRGARFFMVSDDNGKAIQRTLLVYFELAEDARDGGGARDE